MEIMCSLNPMLGLRMPGAVVVGIGEGARGKQDSLLCQGLDTHLVDHRLHG